MRAKLYRPTKRNIAYLAGRLKAGELVGVPSETVYGLAANALDAAACGRIFRAKGRPSTDPLIVHVLSNEQLPLVCIPNSAAEKLASAFWPGPLTMVLPKRDVVPDIVTAARPSVAIRIPSHRVFRQLLRVSGLPLAAPSANPFGYISPTTAEHVRDGLGKKIKYVLEGGPSQVGLESTIVDLRDPERPSLLRLGAISQDQIEATLNRKIKARRDVQTKTSIGALAPGMLTRHYSPRIPVRVFRKITDTTNPSIAYLFVKRPARNCGPNEFWLDSTGNLNGAASRLFACMRKIDRSGFRALHVELAPHGEGLGSAINDRLHRAAAR